MIYTCVVATQSWTYFWLKSGIFGDNRVTTHAELYDLLHYHDTLYSQRTMEITFEVTGSFTLGIIRELNSNVPCSTLGCLLMTSRTTEMWTCTSPCTRSYGRTQRKDRLTDLLYICCEILIAVPAPVLAESGIMDGVDGLSRTNGRTSGSIGRGASRHSAQMFGLRSAIAHCV
jgi:hypothetical protein